MKLFIESEWILSVDALSQIEIDKLSSELDELKHKHSLETSQQAGNTDR